MAIYPEVKHTYFKRGQAGQVFAVMCEGGGLPTVLHDRYNKAAHEAARLAHNNHGLRFHVLASHKVSVGEAEVAVEAEQVSA